MDEELQAPNPRLLRTSSSQATPGFPHPTGLAGLRADPEIALLSSILPVVRRRLSCQRGCWQSEHIPLRRIGVSLEDQEVDAHGEASVLAVLDRSGTARGDGEADDRDVVGELAAVRGLDCGEQPVQQFRGLGILRGERYDGLH
jgi:hypothetical protein